MIDLEDLGWNGAIAAQFVECAARGLEPARVSQELRGAYRVFGAAGESPAQITGRLRRRAATALALPAVGDWVAVALEPGGLAIIEEVMPRRTELVRKAAGRTSEPQVIGANVDAVFVVTSLNSDFSLRRIERMLALVAASGADPVVVLNKADLCDDPADAVAAVGSAGAAVPTLALSALTGAGIEALAPFLGRGRTVAVIGSSGVGKSTLVNRLLGAEQLDVGAIREADDRGRHTTTRRELVLLPAGGVLIDTPGMRELGLVADASASAAFGDIVELSARCRFGDCAHRSEPGCAVQAALADGTLDAERHASYTKLEKELAHAARREDQQAALAEKRRWKVTTVAAKRRDRGRR